MSNRTKFNNNLIRKLDDNRKFQNEGIRTIDENVPPNRPAPELITCSKYNSFECPDLEQGKGCFGDPYDTLANRIFVQGKGYFGKLSQLHLLSGYKTDDTGGHGFETLLESVQDSIWMVNGITEEDFSSNHLRASLDQLSQNLLRIKYGVYDRELDRLVRDCLNLVRNYYVPIIPTMMDHHGRVRLVINRYYNYNIEKLEHLAQLTSLLESLLCVLCLHYPFSVLGDVHHYIV